MGERRALLASFLVVFIASVAFYLIKPALALRLRAELGATALEVTALTSGFMVARALAAPLTGFAGDRAPLLRGRVARLCLLPVALLSAAYAFVPEALLAVLLSAVHGFFSGMFWPTLQVIVGFSAPEDKRGAYLGAYFTLGALGSSIGYALYGLLPLSSTYLILAGAALYALSAMLALLLFSACTPAMPAGHRREVRLRLSSLPPLALWVLVISFAVGGVMGLMNEYLYLFLYEVHGMTRAELGYVLTAAALLSVFSGALSGFLSDMLGIRRVLVAILLLCSLGLLSLTLSHSGVIVALSLATVLLAVKATLPLTRNIAVAGGSRLEGTVVGLANTFSSAGAAVLPLVAGYLYDALEGEEVLGIDGRALPLLLSSLAVLFLALISPLAEGRR
ncbi:MAG: MFS transporter [Euryarchaeota archaeon]|nr:MFS transporter [Euryarchaeota archaeon]